VREEAAGRLGSLRGGRRVRGVPCRRAGLIELKDW
ncbi:26S proteasome complex subunit SEM1 isoform g, partial [Daubentonia madagascariensis]